MNIANDRIRRLFNNTKKSIKNRFISNSLILMIDNRVILNLYNTKLC